MKTSYLVLGFATVLAIAACDKNTARRSPKNIVPATKCKLGFDLEDVNNKIKQKFSGNDNIVVRTVVVKGDLIAAGADGTMATEREISDKTVSEFESSSDKMTLTKNCKMNEAQYTGPGAEGGFVGKVEKIKKDSITLTQGKKGKNGFRQLEIKKDKVDEKDYAGLLAQENGINIVKVKILTLGDKKGVFEAIQYVAEKNSTGALETEVKVDVSVLKQIAQALGAETPEIITKSIEKAGDKSSIKINANELAKAQALATSKAKPLVVVGESTTSDDLSEVHVTAKKLGDGSTTDDLFAQMCGKLSEQELNDSQKADREKFQNGILILQPEGVEITEENFGPLALNCEILNVLQTRIEEKTCLDNEDKAIDITNAKKFCENLAKPAPAVGSEEELPEVVVQAPRMTEAEKEAYDLEEAFQLFCGNSDMSERTAQQKENRESFINQLNNIETIFANVDEDDQDVAFNCAMTNVLKDKLNANGCLDDSGIKVDHAQAVEKCSTYENKIDFNLLAF